MPIYMIERAYAEELNITADGVRLIEEVNADEGVRWLFSFLSADKRRSYCLYEAPRPTDPRRRRQGGTAGRRDRRGRPRVGRHVRLSAGRGRFRVGALRRTMTD